ncbi:MAG: aminotransferase class III-fold pyridoxal phosphate-dependent enzyme [Eubacteriales bacterium]|nr:aminotransferase class III-fold pyridoxal phosphate-dependent enzyme [Eubacteriales bacterium]
MKLDYLNGFDYAAVHERAKYVLENTKRLKPEAEKECLDWFEKNCATSKKTIEEAKTAIPGGVQHNLANNYPFALNCVKGEGPYLYDIDGNRYIDFIGAGGPSILGNKDPEVVEAVWNTINTTGYLTGLFHEYEYKLAAKVKEFFPSVEKFRMMGSGSEACMAAIRAARAFSGKTEIVKLKGTYHGISDQLIYDIRYCNSKNSFAAGVPDECYGHISAVMVNDLNELEDRFKENEKKGGTACFIMEAMGQDSGVLPTTREYHKGVRALCDRYDVILIYDEVVTAFRLALGGAQEYFDTRADITVFGKIIAGGFASAGGFGGREDIMGVLTAGVAHIAGNKIVVGGTLTANPVSCCAGYTTLCKLQREDIPNKLNAAGEKFARQLTDLANKYEIPAIISSTGSVMQIDLTGMKHVATFSEYSLEEQAAKRKFASERMTDFAMALAANGILTAGGNKTFLSYAALDRMEEVPDVYEKVFSMYE